MVKLPRHATEQPTAWPQWKFFFSCFLFFFSFYLLFLLKPSPIFFHFFLSFSNWFLCSSQAFDCNTLRISNSSSCYSCNMDIPASSFLFHFKLFYDKLTILSEKQKIAHNQLNAEGLVASGAQKAIKEIGNRSQGGEGKHLPPPLPPWVEEGGRKRKRIHPRINRIYFHTFQHHDGTTWLRTIVRKFSVE